MASLIELFFVGAADGAGAADNTSFPKKAAAMKQKEKLLKRKEWPFKENCKETFPAKKQIQPKKIELNKFSTKKRVGPAPLRLKN